MSPQQQIELGKKVVNEVYQQMPVLPDSSPVTQYVQALGQTLAAQAPGYRWPYNFHVVNVADINAFALPGGSIFVNLGTIQAASNEAQLAAAMSHEISHVALQHSVCNLEKEKRVGIFAGIGEIASGLILGNSTLGALAQKTIGLTAGLSFLRMGREAEQQADLEGVGILYDAGYDPRAMPQFFETIQGKYGKGGAQFLSDHPNPGNRTEYVNREISSFVPRARYVTNTADFKRIQQQVSGMRAYTAKEVESGVWKRKDPNQTVSTGVNEYDAGAPVGTRVDTTLPQQWITFTGNGFTMQVPSDWKAAGDRNSAMVAPPGGISPSADGKTGNLVYGVLTDLYDPDPQEAGGDTFASLVDELARENPGIQAGQISNIRIGDVTAQSVDAVNRSANNGNGEHDWIVGIPRERTPLRYFVFVSPAQDSSAMRPTFEHIINSIRLSTAGNK
ncbi:M48 family metallopeptidase [Occallatibacter savannae]|uniref:M48 family metallopeptidase n=1 Tax=Occallatibacter savannae TaxID=1002691 RepID=UPI0013A585B0|nr:M48 family metallopeptidase [Occallatibacter savannae]